MATRRIKGWWYADFRVAGIRYRKRSPENSRAGAQAWELVLRQRLARGEDIDATPTKAEKLPTFAEFAPEWMESYVRANNKPSEQKTKAVILRAHLVPFFGGMPLAQVDGREIERFKRAQLDKGLAPKSINNHLAVLRRALVSAEEWNRLARAPKIQWLRCPPPIIDFLSDAEVTRLLAHAHEPEWHRAITFAVRTGVRVGELLALDWSCVDLDRREVVIRRSIYDGVFSTPKSNRARHIPLAADLTDILLPWKRAAGLVFGRTSERPWSDDWAEKALASACAQAGVRRIGWHTLRHTFATQLVERGVPIRDIQKLLGHSTVTMTERYAHVTPSVLRRAVDLLVAPANHGQPMGIEAPSCVPPHIGANR